MAAKRGKRERQRAARELRRRSPRELLEVGLEDGFQMDPFPWDLGEGVEYAVLAFVGECPEGLSELAEDLPDQCAIEECPTTIALVRIGSEAERRASGGGD